MSCVLVDIGNSRIKWGRLDGKAVTHTRAVFHASERHAGFSTVLDSLPADMDRVLACNVAGVGLQREFSAALSARFDVEVEWQRTVPVQAGVVNGYDKPELLGVDRWLALIGAHAAALSPALVVDAGTACTMDALHAHGRHGGGVILPGSYLMRQSLLGNTSDIAASAEASGNGSAHELLATSTAQAVRNGCSMALIGAIERAYRLLLDLEPAAQLVITGGDAPGIALQLRVAFVHRPALVLEGLAAVATEDDEP